MVLMRWDLYKEDMPVIVDNHNSVIYLESAIKSSITGYKLQPVRFAENGKYWLNNVIDSTNSVYD